MGYQCLGEVKNHSMGCHNVDVVTVCLCHLAAMWCVADRQWTGDSGRVCHSQGVAGGQLDPSSTRGRCP